MSSDDPVSPEAAVAQLRDLRGAYDKLRRRFEDAATGERQSARAAAEVCATFSRFVRRSLVSLEVDEARERELVSSLEEADRDTLVLRQRVEETGLFGGRASVDERRLMRSSSSPVPPSGFRTVGTARFLNGTASPHDDFASSGAPNFTLDAGHCESDSDDSVRFVADDANAAAAAAAVDRAQASSPRPRSNSSIPVSPSAMPFSPAVLPLSLDQHAAPPALAASSSSSTCVNPNVMGEPVASQAHHQWYLTEAIRKTLLLHASLVMDAIDPASTPGEVSGCASPRACASPRNRREAMDAQPPAAAGGLELDPEVSRDRYRQGDVSEAVAAGLRRAQSFETGRDRRKKKGTFASLRASLSKRKNEGAVAQEVKYHTHLMQGFVDIEIGTEHAGRLGPLARDATNPQLRERFGLKPDGADALAEEASEDSGSRQAAAHFNSFERLYGKHEDPTASVPLPLTAGPSGPSKREYRVDELLFTFRAEAHLRIIRDALDVRLEDVRNHCGSRSTNWRVGISPGKSESMFLYFGHLVAKSVSEGEFKFLCDEYLEPFAEYAEKSPFTLLPHFQFVFSVTWLASRRTMRFVVMNNVFRTSHFIERMYDLKGSTVGRDGFDASTGRVTTTTGFGAVLLKDNDVPDRLIVCGPLRRAMLVAQVQSDAGFLQKLNVVDYSLLIGVRSRVLRTSDAAMLAGTSTSGVYHSRTRSGADPLAASTGHRRTLSDTLGVGMSPTPLSGAQPSYNPGAPEELDGRCFRSHDGGLVSLPVHDSSHSNEAREETFYLGIIDVLQQFNGAKRLESMAKSLFFDGNKISVVPPADFSQRLSSLIERITL